jgi:hypothetical protein
VVAVSDVAHSKIDQIAGSELAVDGQVEQGQVSYISGELDTYPNGPDVSEPEWCFLSDEFAFVQRCTVSSNDFCGVHE